MIKLIRSTLVAAVAITLLLPPIVLQAAVPTYRAAAHDTAPSSGDNRVINKPTGTVDDDIMIATIYAEPETQEITAPAGWTSFAKLENTGYPFAIELFWKRAATEGASYTFSMVGNTWGGGSIVSIAGAINSGSPLDVVGVDNTGNDAIPTALGVTTLTTDTLLLYISSNGNGTASGVPSGMTERYDTDVSGNQYLATLDLASTGATGNKAGSYVGTEQWAAILVAISSGGSGGGPSFISRMLLLGIGD